MLDVMNQRDGNGELIPFGPITWVTNNKKLNTGGEKITMESAVLVGVPSKRDHKYNLNHLVITPGTSALRMATG